MYKPYLLFDAGGTLVFPDQLFLIQLAQKYGVELTEEQLFSGYYRLIHRLDQKARVQGKLPCDPWLPEGYAYTLFETLDRINTATIAVAQDAETRHHQESLWTFTFKWVPEVLSHLAVQGYRMSVVSNSNGDTDEVFCSLGLAQYFEGIFSSHELGIEKPDPAIFGSVLNKLDLLPADVLYIGDIFEVDVRGANQAGIGALHLDPLGLYDNYPGVHLPDVRHLPGWLARYAAAPFDFDLFPIRSLDRTAHTPPRSRYFFAQCWSGTSLGWFIKPPKRLSKASKALYGYSRRQERSISDCRREPSSPSRSRARILKAPSDTQGDKA
jgi:HAD superfamily hydrolase (TIGR01549 family)